MSFLLEFSQQIADILPYARTESFPSKLAVLFKSLVPSDNVMIVAFHSKSLPIVEYNDNPPEDRVSMIDKFVAGAFLLDPYYLAATKQGKYGFFHLKDIAPSGFDESEYNRLYYKLSGLCDECGYVLRLKDNDKTFVHISLGQIGDCESYNEDCLQKLSDITPLIDALIKYHWQEKEVESDSQLDLREQLETALESFGTSILTERENQMVQMILHGYSSKAIAERFKISVETVKLHRKNAYAKLDLGTQGELFNLFINSLINIDNYEGGDPLISYHSKATSLDI
ncbi:MAG: helix-turn-helix transcriptional regulator [Gammaproteobacteria bacterium]|nr:helix-turn-helix transcriptional regulator [Gammaproteobacteria bacterium]